jgi:paraquat-inducible protein B
MFRDLEVGEVLGWDIGAMARNVVIHAFVRAPYDQYVHDNSVFWDASGASLQLGGNGVRLQLESLRAVVLGGVAFETPDKAVDSPVADENHLFALHPDHDAAEAATFDRSLKFVSYFKGSVAGLSADAAVTLRGLRIGTVTDVALKYDPVSDTVRVAVRYDIEPGRISGLVPPGNDDPDKMMADLVHRGLRVRLESSSIITGSKQLAMDLVPGTPETAYGKEGDTYVLAPLDG